MLVVCAGSELPGLAGVQVDDENVQPLVVVEMRVALARSGLVEIARDHDRVACSVGRFRPRLCRNIRDPRAVRRPCDRPTGGRQRAVRPLHRRE